MMHSRTVGALLAIALAIGFGGTAMAASDEKPAIVPENVEKIGDVEKQDPECLLSLIMPTPSEGNIDENTEDVYCTTVLPGSSVHFKVDTVSPDTAGDLFACLSTSPDLIDAFFCGDDNFACTHPPPAFSCPEGTATAPGDAIEVYTIVGAWDPWSPTAVDYELTLDSDGTPLGANLVEDDRPEQGP